MLYCYLNSELLPEHKASIGVKDLTLLRGYGVFDFFLFDEKGPRFIEDYLSRFFKSAEQLNLETSVDNVTLYQRVLELIDANKQKSGGIRLVLTGGYSEDSYTPNEGNLLILQSPFPHISKELFERGASAATYLHQREFPEAKSLTYTTGIKLLPWLKEQNALYPLYHDGRYLRESDRSNFFLVDSAGTLVTSDRKILRGITRAKVIELAGGCDLQAELREVELSELWSARELFFTSSIKGVMPVTKIDNKPIGDGKVGSITKLLQTAYLDLCQQ